VKHTSTLREAEDACARKQPQVKRCDEMLRKLRFFSDQMHKADIMVSPKGGIPKVRGGVV
jgi:hypothetical protein